ncbi:MAG: hypothetical protein HUJ30_05600 [Gammaproteobacteria bacterium]|nr:hypothetical protein [Gammaproteobacteria bacterium]
MTTDQPFSGRGSPGLSCTYTELLEQLQKQDSQNHRPYLLLEPINPSQARFIFSAHFEGQAVIWDTTLVILQHYQQLQADKLQQPLPPQAQQFIDITATSGPIRPILVAHAIKQVNHSSILKTIIMLRNYKRLHVGRHYYGELHQLGT